MPPVDRFRVVTAVTVQRLRLAPFGEDKYGHWWLEVGDPFDPESESYGWWPAKRVGVIDTLTGVAGSLNGVEEFGGRDFQNPPPRDERLPPTLGPRPKRSDNGARVRWAKRIFRWRSTI